MILKLNSPWFGEVPDHWKVLPIRALFREIKETNFPTEPLLSVTISRGVIRQQVLLEENAIKDSSNDDRSAYKLACPNDIVYNKMRAWQGAIGVSGLRGIVSPAYVVARLQEGSDPRYFHYLFRTLQFAKEAERWSYGITSDMWSLRYDHLKMIYCPVPPPDEQSLIVRYLDRVDLRIQMYIATKQKLIKLLEEQRQAIFDNVIARGLNPCVRLKASGVDWLGDVPEHWVVTRLKRVITPIEQGWSPQCDAEPATTNEWGVLKVGCVNRDTFDAAQNKRLPPTLEPPPELEVRGGDILVSRANTRELVGLAALVVDPRPMLLLCDKLFRFRALPEQVDSRFLVYAMRGRSSRAQIESCANGASDSMQNIGQGVVRDLYLCLPQIDEQRRVVAALAVQSASLSTAISRAEKGIDLVQEYRARLIADMVTGKLDVQTIRKESEPELFKDSYVLAEQEKSADRTLPGGV